MVGKPHLPALPRKLHETGKCVEGRTEDGDLEGAHEIRRHRLTSAWSSSKLQELHVFRVDQGRQELYREGGIIVSKKVKKLDIVFQKGCCAMLAECSTQSQVQILAYNISFTLNRAFKPRSRDCPSLP